jgi:hypothetical protein
MPAADLKPCPFCAHEKPTLVAMGGETVERVIRQHAHVAAVRSLSHQAIDEDGLGAELVEEMNHSNPLGDVG